MENNPYQAPKAEIIEQAEIRNISSQSNKLLDRRTFFIKEHVAVLKLSDTYDILDPVTNKVIGIAKEKPGDLMKALRLIINKRLLPTKVGVYEGTNYENESKRLFSITRGVTLFRPKVNILDHEDNFVGYFKAKLFSFGGAFRVFDAANREIALVKGDWKGWNFKMTNNSGTELGTVTKKWAGIGKELFTSADNYIISLKGELDQTNALLLLAAGLAVDIIYKER